MLNLTLKQIQCALADGQLDEACRLLQADAAVGACRRGQKLTTQLATALVQRGRDHLAAGRLDSALQDCNKAAALGGGREEIAALRQAVCRAMQDKQQVHQRRAARLATAEQQIGRGWLTAGLNLLADESSPGAAPLKDRALAERQRLAAAATKIDDALQRDDVRAALTLLNQVGPARLHDPALARLADAVTERVVAYVTEHVSAGALDLAAKVLTDAADLDDGQGRLERLRRGLAQCRRAADYLQAGRARQAAVILAGLRGRWPDAAWLVQATQDAQHAAEAAEALQAGPLGLLADSIATTEIAGTVAASLDSVTIPAKQEPAAMAHAPAPLDSPGANLPDRFIMQIDGVGAFLTVRGDAVTIGPVSATPRPAVGLLAGAHLPTVTLERHEQDYVLRSTDPIHVGSQRIEQRLLTDGDKIALSDRCRMRFNRPNVASGTATLSLSSARLPRPDITRVILMDREVLVGPGAGNHVQTAAVDKTVAFYVRQGRLCCRSDEPVFAGQRLLTADTPLPLDEPLRIGGLGVVVSTRCD